MVSDKHHLLLGLIIFSLFPYQGHSQYGGEYNMEYEVTEYEEQPDFREQDGQPQQPVEPPLLIPQDPNTVGMSDKPTIFKLPENYSVHKAPPLLDGKPIPVDFSMLIFNVFDIKEIQEEISLEVNYKLYWRDVRLLNWTKNIDPGQRFATISTTLLHRIWHPDIFIDHIKRVTQPQLISSASSLRIYSDGSLRYTSRILLVLTCRMNFHFYPADTQQCNVTMKSFAFSTRQISLQWRDGIGALLAKSIDVHNFDVALQRNPDYLQLTKSNNYSALSFGIKLRRKLSYHIIQTYVPSTLFTIVSWLSFLVPPDSTPGRMAICVTTLLTVTSMFGSVKSNTPNVSYIKAIDVWMFLCIVFIFLSLAEFTVVLKLRNMKVSKPRRKSSLVGLKPKRGQQVIEIERTGNHVNSSIALPSQENNLSNNVTTILQIVEPSYVIPIPPPDKPPPTKYFKLAMKIEKYAPKIVPLIFVIFTSIYWPYLLIGSEYYSLNKSPEMYYTV